MYKKYIAVNQTYSILCQTKPMLSLIPQKNCLSKEKSELSPIKESSRHKNNTEIHY